jgi:hypothetical protein
MTPLLLHQGIAAYGPISVVSALIIALIVASLTYAAFFAPFSSEDDAEAARPRKRRSRKAR